MHPVTTHKASAGVMRTLLQLAQQTRALTAGPQLARALTAGPQLARAFTAGPQLARAFTAGPHTLEGHGVKALLLVSKRGMAFCSTEVTEHGTHDQVRARDPGTGSGPASPPPLPPPEVVAALVSALEVALGRDHISTGEAVLLQHAQVRTTVRTILWCKSTIIWIN